MEYRTAIEIDIHHQYWGAAAAPCIVVAADPAVLRRAGLILRSDASGAVLIAPTEGEGLPDRVSLDVIAEDMQLIGLTQGWRSEVVPVFAPDISHAPDAEGIHITISPNSPAASELPRLPGDRRLCRLSLPLVVADDPVICRVECAAVQALWAYHIVGKGAGDPIHIVDDANAIAFDDLGEEALPDGRIARVLRSSLPVPIRQRSAIRLVLKEDQPPPYDPEILIPVLPVGGANLRPVTGDTSADILQSDIYVSL